MNVRAWALALPLALWGCSQPSGEGSNSGVGAESADARKRIAVCEEVMKNYIQEAKTYDRDRKRLIGSCQISQRERTLEQWQCVLDGQRKGEKYVEASDRCGRTPSESGGGGD